MGLCHYVAPLYDTHTVSRLNGAAMSVCSYHIQPENTVILNGKTLVSRHGGGLSCEECLMLFLSCFRRFKCFLERA